MIVKSDPRVDKEIRVLSEADSARIVSLIELFRQYGFALTLPYLKKLTVNLWELRSGRWRLLLGLANSEAIIVNLFLKKSQKTPKREIDLAKKRLNEYL